MRTFYVSAGGNDRLGDGTKNNPFASLEKARSEYHALVKLKTCEKAIIYIRGGHYVFKEAVTFSQEDSHLTIAACPGEKVIFSGAELLKGLKWYQDETDSRIYCAYIGKGLQPDRLFVNKIPYHMARFPNFQEGKVPLGGTVCEAQIKERSRRWKHPETGYVQALHEAAWGGNDYYILGKNEESPLGLDIEWIGDNNRGNRYKADDLAVENIREELDAPGEWFYDGQSGILSMIPLESENRPFLENEMIELSLNSEILRFRGADFQNPITDITLSGITFENTSRTMFTTKQPGKEYVPLMRGDWAVVRSGAVYLENAEQVTIEKCTFSQIGGNGIFGWGYQKDHLICSNEMLHIGATAILFAGSPKAVSDPSFWEHMYYPENQVHAASVARPDHVGPVTEDYPRDIEISENHIFDVGIYEKQSTGISLSVSSRFRILYNTIHKSTRSNININDGSFGGHEIAYNDIFDSQTETADHGPFNSWGRDRFWSVPVYDCMGNNGKFIRHYKKDGKEYDISLLDAYQTTRIHHNRFHHDNKKVHSWGIDLDDGSSNYEIYENLCLGIGIKLREGFERRVHHNVFIDGKLELHCPYWNAGDRIYANLFVHQNPWGIAGAGSEIAARMQDANLYIDENAYFYPTAQVTKLKICEELGYDCNSVWNENPDFADPGANDYRITNESMRKRLQLPTGQAVHYGKHGCGCQAPVYALEMSYEKTKLFETSWMGAVISDIDQAIMSATATAGTKGVFFKEVPTDSAAYKLGFRTNQIVKQINGEDVDHAAAFIRKWKEAEQEGK